MYICLCKLNHVNSHKTTQISINLSRREKPIDNHRQTNTSTTFHRGQTEHLYYALRKRDDFIDLKRELYQEIKDHTYVYDMFN